MFYKELEMKYIKHCYNVKAYVYKLVKLLCVDNTKELNNLEKCLLRAMKLRNLTLLFLFNYIL